MYVLMWGYFSFKFNPLLIKQVYTLFVLPFGPTFKMLTNAGSVGAGGGMQKHW